MVIHANENDETIVNHCRSAYCNNDSVVIGSIGESLFTNGQSLIADFDFSFGLNGIEFPTAKNLWILEVGIYEEDLWMKICFLTQIDYHRKWTFEIKDFFGEREWITQSLNKKYFVSGKNSQSLKKNQIFIDLVQKMNC